MKKFAAFAAIMGGILILNSPANSQITEEKKWEKLVEILVDINRYIGMRESFRCVLAFADTDGANCNAFTKNGVNVGDIKISYSGMATINKMKIVKNCTGVNLEYTEGCVVDIIATIRKGTLGDPLATNADVIWVK